MSKYSGRNETPPGMEVGKSYTGTISAVTDSGNYAVTCDQTGELIADAYLVTPPLGGLLGFVIKARLPVGTRVTFIYDAPSPIYGVIPDFDTDRATADSRMAVGGPTVREGRDRSTNPMPKDMHDGEFEISNMHGVVLQFLTTLLKVGAGDLAKIEFSLVENLMRLVSEQYRHVSALGDEVHYDYGRPTRERNWTSYRHEACNLEKEGDPLSPTDGDEARPDDMLDDAYLRARFRELEGFAGDFIHSLITDPPAAIVSLAAPETANAAGKSLFARLSDGTVLLHSVAELRFEKVVRTLVPVRKTAYDAEDIDRKYRDLNYQYLKIWEGWRNADDAWRMAYQVRQYSRWLSQFYALARVRAMGDQYQIPAETEAPAPDPNNREDDRLAANGEFDYIETYACVCILRDGSIQAINGRGAVFNMVGEDVSMSAPRHMYLESGGDTHLVVGRNLSVRVHGDTEFAAEGSLLFLAKQHITLVWKSMLRLLRPPSPPDADEAPAVFADINGHVLGKVARLELEGADVALGFDHATVKSETAKVVVRGSVWLRVSGPISALIDTLYGRYREISMGDVFLRNGVAWLKEVIVDQLWANNSITGPRGPNQKIEGSNSSGTSHYGHIRNFTKEEDKKQLLTGDDAAGLAALIAAEEMEARLEFDEVAKFEWVLDGYKLPRTLTQTFLASDDLPDSETTEPWNLETTGRVDDALYTIKLFGANGAQFEFSTTGISLFTPGDCDAAPTADWTAGPPIIKTYKPS